MPWRVQSPGETATHRPSSEKHAGRPDPLWQNSRRGFILLIGLSELQWEVRNASHANRRDGTVSRRRPG